MKFAETGRHTARSYANKKVRMMATTDLEICNDGAPHQFRYIADRSEGMVCAGCGVSEAELQYLTDGIPPEEGRE